MVPLLLPLNRFHHRSQVLRKITDNRWKGVIESILISKLFAKGLTSQSKRFCNYHDKCSTAAMVFICLAKNK